MIKPIPISAAKRIAEDYGYDQVIVIARKTGEGGREHCTTYGVNKEHCAVAARCGDFLKYEIMEWEKPAPGKPEEECHCSRHEENGHYRHDCPHCPGVCAEHGKDNCGPCSIVKGSKWIKPAHSEPKKPAPDGEGRKMP